MGLAVSQAYLCADETAGRVMLAATSAGLRGLALARTSQTLMALDIQDVRNVPLSPITH